MPRVSRNPLSQKQINTISEHFSYLIASLNNHAEIQDFCNEFFTPEEKLMLAKRVVLFMMVTKGYSSLAMQTALHMSYETVRVYTLQYAHKSEIFKRKIKKITQRDEAQLFWKKIDAILKPL